MSEVKETARPRFFVQPVQNEAKTLQEGRPIFESKRFVELKHPGDKTWSFIEEINEEGKGRDKGEDYAERFPREFAAFKKGEERASYGTPLDEWQAITRSRALELKAMNVFTVEELAEIQDGQLSKLGMNTRSEREQARTFLASSKAGADPAAMAAKIAQLTAIVERLQSGQPQEQPKEKTLEDCTDTELKDYIARETGERPKGNPSRETLLKRAAEVNQQAAA